MSWANATWYYFVLTLARFAFLLLGPLRSSKSSLVPMEGPLIVAPLHVSHLDPPAVACGTNRRLRFMAKEELFKSKLFGRFISSLGAFPVKRGDGDTESIRLAMKLLNEGEAVLIFPEGTRGDGDAMLPINRGVAMLAKRTGAPVIPVGVIGTHQAWPKGQKKIRKFPIVIAFGEPFTYAEIAKHDDEKQNREAFTKELEKRILKLCAEHGLKLKSASYSERSTSAPARSSSP